MFYGFIYEGGAVFKECAVARPRDQVRRGYGEEFARTSPEKLRRAVIVDEATAAARWILGKEER